MISRPVILGSLAFLGGAFWVRTLNQNFKTQKEHSQIFKSLILYLKHKPELRSALGNFQYDKVTGNVDMLGGKCDVEFMVKGEHKEGIVIVKAKRLHLDFWDCDVKIDLGDRQLHF